MLGGAVVCAAVSAGLCLVGAPATGPRSDQGPASPYLVLTATSLDASGLAYAGTFSVQQPDGPAQVLRFTMTRGAVVGLRLTQPCAAGTTAATTADSASLTGATFDAVSLAASIGGVPVTFTVESPPAGAFPADLQLQSVTLTAVTLSAATMSTASIRTAATAC